MMVPIPGTPVPLSPLASLRWVRDLVSLDGPLLSEFRNHAGEPFLSSWVDRDAVANRWLVFRTKERDLILLTMRRLDLHALVMTPVDGFVYVVDLDGEFKQRQCSAVAPRELPSDYQPDKGSFLPARRGPARGETYAVLIDKEWDTDELSEFPSKYRGAYLALYAYGRGAEDRPVEPVGRNLPWRGGFSAVHFYKSLLASTPRAAQPRIDAFVYASPGFVRWRLDAAVAQELREALTRFGESREAIHAAAGTAYGFIRAHGLNDEHAKITDDIRSDLGMLFHDLARALGSVDGDRILSVHGENVFACLKILLSIYTRLRFLYEMSARDMATF